MVKYVTEKNTQKVKLEFTQEEKTYLKKIYREDIERTERILKKRIESWHE